MQVPASTTPDSAGGTPPPTEPFVGRPLALSPSRAIDFKQCPLKYRLRAIDRIPEPPSTAAVRGTLVHAVLEALFGLPATDRLPEAAAALVEPAWARLIADRPEVADVVADGGLPVLLAEVADLVRVYFTLEDPTTVDPESVEFFLETELPDGSPVRGIVDRIDRAADDALHIVDYKTGRSPAPAYEARALFQLKFYALVLLHTRGVVPAQLRLLYLADGQTLTYEPDADELRRFQRIVSALWAAIDAATKTGDFPPNRGWMCDYCDYRALCPEFGGTPPPYPGVAAAIAESDAAESGPARSGAEGVA
ncbi:RecB family exonuclease [Nocardia sp. CC201C]|uniref:RecB family exonuclease n=1 Tax=Nocardia sp. CC201C TaxID=3044575 RepID=UPI0024A847D6|nr:RecB family exonuclease [Nocardia sp. CC201C]